MTKCQELVDGSQTRISNAKCLSSGLLEMLWTPSGIVLEAGQVYLYCSHFLTLINVISSGANRQSHHIQLCEFIQTTPVGAVLESVDTENCEEFYKFYLHDFVKSVHKCKHENAEHDDMEHKV